MREASIGRVRPTLMTAATATLGSDKGKHVVSSLSWTSRAVAVFVGPAEAGHYVQLVGCSRTLLLRSSSVRLKPDTTFSWSDAAGHYYSAGRMSYGVHKCHDTSRYARVRIRCIHSRFRRTRSSCDTSGQLAQRLPFGSR